MIKLPTTIESQVSTTPSWDAVRGWIGKASLFEQCKLFSQVMAGYELLALHQSIGVSNGSKAHLSQNGKGSWEEIVEKETGLSRSVAYRFMDMAKAAAPRLKKLPALAQFVPGEKPISALPAPQKEALENAVRKLTDGQTQQEFGELFCGWKSRNKAQGRKPGEGGRKKLSLSEQAELLRTLATEDWKEIDRQLSCYRDKFTCLADADVTAQIAALEQALKARKTWLHQPLTQRDPKAIAAFFT